MKKVTIVLLLVIAAFALIFPVFVIKVAHADTTIAAIGDTGCKTAAKDNLNNIADSGLPLLGVGDYKYKCSVSDLRPMWKEIETKHGVPGNHEYDSGSYSFVKETMGITDKGYFSWKLGDIAIIGINQYVDYKEGSAQYDWVKLKTKTFADRSDINWIIYVFHEPIHTPTTEGGHGPAKTFRNTYLPIIDAVPNSFVIQAHNHISAFGNVGGVNQVLCGGGGQGGDSLGNLNGYESATEEFGYCKLDFKKDSIVGQLIGTDGETVEESHTWVK